MKEAKSKLGYLVTRPIVDYWSWWTEELMSVMPISMRQILFNTNKLILEIDNDEVEIYRIIANRKIQVARLIINDLISNKASSQIKGIVKETNVTERILVIPNHQVLEKNISFPMATEENLREVLSFEMDRLTPFASNQVYYDYSLISRNKQKGTMDLKLVIVPKDRLDKLLKKLDDIGFKPHIVTIKGDKTDKGLQINLLPSEKRAKRINALKIVNYSLTGILLILILISLILPIWNKSKFIEKLQPELDKYSTSAEQIISLRKQVEKAENEALFLVEKKQASVLMLEVIDELTQIIPDDTWVNQVDVNDGEVHVHGESVSSASLLPIMESSHLFSSAQFRSPVTQNRRNNTERFHLSAKIKQEQTL
jgi:general secretion pathway protein L